MFFDARGKRKRCLLIICLMFGLFAGSCNLGDHHDNIVEAVSDDEVVLPAEHIQGQFLVSYTTEGSAAILEGNLSIEETLKGVSYVAVKCLTPSYFEGGLHPDVYHIAHIAYCVSLKQKDDESLKTAIKTVRKRKGVAASSANEIMSPADYGTGQRRSERYQWALSEPNGINVQNAWNNYTHGSRKTKIGILDCGVYDHDDLYINRVISYTSSAIPTDPNDHGTHVAGICGARADDDGQGIMGVCNNADIVDLKISSSVFVENNNEPGGGHYDVFCNVGCFVEAINKVNALWGTTNQIDVLNYSYGGFGNQNDTIMWAVKSYPGTFVWAAGNNHQLIMDKDYRFCPNLISVGSYGREGLVSSFSNYGEAVNIFAPGEGIVSTIRNNGYRASSGTSMAAPFVAGAAALIYSKYPGISARLVKNAITESVEWQKVGRLISDEGADPTYALEPIKKLDVEAALRKAGELFRDLKKDRLSLEMLRCDGGKWTVLVKNLTSEALRVICANKTMTTDAAMNFNPDASMHRIDLAPLASKIIEVIRVGDNLSVAAACFDVKNGIARRHIKYLCRNYWDTGSQNRYPVYDQGSTYLTIYDYIPAQKVSPLKFKVKDSRINWFVKDWKIVIENTAQKNITVKYNSKMCFIEDGKKWTNLYDVKTVKLGPGESSGDIWIGANGTAGAIAVCYEYVDDKGDNKRLITASDGISNNKTYSGPNYVMTI